MKIEIQSEARNLTSCQLWEGIDRQIFEMAEFLGVLWKGWDLKTLKTPPTKKLANLHPHKVDNSGGSHPR